MRCVLCVVCCVVYCVLSGVVLLGVVWRCLLRLVVCCVLFVGVLYGCLSFVDRCEWLFDCGGSIAVCWMM